MTSHIRYSPLRTIKKTVDHLIEAPDTQQLASHRPARTSSHTCQCSRSGCSACFGLLAWMILASVVILIATHEWLQSAAARLETESHVELLRQLPSVQNADPKCDTHCRWSRSWHSPSLSRTCSATGTDWSSFVSSENFYDMADWVYHPAALNRYRCVADVVAAVRCLPTGALIHVHADLLDDFFRDVHSNITRPYFLITGLATVTVPGRWAKYLEDEPALSEEELLLRRPNGTSNTTGGLRAANPLLHWFGKNGVSSSPRFSQIPIGLNLYEHPDSLEGVLRHHGAIESGQVYPQDLPGVPRDPRTDTAGKEERCRNQSFTSSRTFQPRIRSFRWSHPPDEFNDWHWAVANFNIDSSRAARQPVYDWACGDPARNLTGQPWVRCHHKDPGVVQFLPQMPQIYRDLSRFRFHISPPGRGIDCHRHWEALYLGVIPIILSSPLDPLYADTPAWIVNDWSEVTVESMQARWRSTVEKWRGRVVDKLHFSYWRDRILQTVYRTLVQRQLLLPGDPMWTDLDQPRQRCWGPRTQSPRIGNITSSLRVGAHASIRSESSPR